jgi:hypothetical protein
MYLFISELLSVSMSAWLLLKVLLLCNPFYGNTINIKKKGKIYTIS